MRLDTAEKRAAYRASMVPAGAVLDPRSNEAGSAYIYGREDRLYSVGFRGTAGHPAFHYRFRDEASREAHLANFFACLIKSAEYKAKCKSERAAEGRGLEVSDILKSVWGYDQTNIDYYEVTRLVGKTQVEIRELCSDSKEDQGWLMGTSTPIAGKYCGDPMIKVARSGSVKIESYAWARKMEPLAVVAGRKMYSPSSWTAYH